MQRLLPYLVLGIFFSTHVAFPEAAPSSPVPPEPEIRKILADRIGNRQDNVGIVVGIIDPEGRRVIAFGNSDKTNSRPLDGNSIFEIGSVTKIFTSLLLADMARRGEVALTDPVSKFLPDGVKMPERGGKMITLQDLAQHRSSLPVMPLNIGTVADPRNPYVNYSVENMYAFLTSYELTRDIGTQFEYSNVGIGLLGHTLSLASHKDYETLVQTRILQPLGMKSSGVALTSDLKSRLAIGHTGLFEATSNWELTAAFEGATAMHSTANDLLSFLAAQLGYTQSELGTAIALTVSKSIRRPSYPGLEIGLGWQIWPQRESEIIWHSGRTGGYRAFIGYDLKAKAGVVLLLNASTEAGCDDIGFHLLNPDLQLLPNNSPLVQPPWESREVSLNTTVLDEYVGKYSMDSIGTVIVVREGDRLYIQLEGQPRFEAFAESKRDFYLQTEDVKITFESDGTGPATALTLHQGGKNFRAVRINK